ncbi:hypothetical protein CN571_15710 [Bacillus pseudomycoides]|uniref:hypothetical protein n=1 Tax=Bacillus pseudomycoides TaxID=64104 RepID=UPI000BF6A360|nr:hypothetical protein [Bacillus pseudomycoides]PEO88144.1 hypothetical protein CN571_15710 [Bacillus pseudomycoides]
MEYYPPVPTWNDYEFAKKNGVPRRNVDIRVRYLGWTIEQAITKPLMSKRDRPGYKGFAEIAEKNGIPYKTFVSRVKILNWSLEEAANTPTKHRSNRRQRGTS